MNDCIFCKIIKGELPSKTFYEDEKIKVIMNIDPVTDGHLLVLPKQHQENILDIDNDLVAYSFSKIKELYPELKTKLNCSGLTICENNELGQDIHHFHLHLIPRYENDEVKLISNKEKLNDLDEVFNKINN
jgi:histidine triad (HIT) family protein